MLYSGFNISPRSVFWSADFNGRSDNTDVIRLRLPSNMLRFRITSALLLMAAIAVGLAWYVDRTRLSAQLEADRHPISRYWEKHNLWSPSLHLATDTNKLEAKLTHRINQFSGDMIVSSQGMSQTELRQPTIATLEAVIELLGDSEPSVQLAAAELIALYLESVSGRSNNDQKSIEIRAYFHATSFDHVKAMLADPNSNIRAAGALTIGNMYYTRDVDRLMKNAFEQENDQHVKICLAWAHYHIAE